MATGMVSTDHEMAEEIRPEEARQLIDAAARRYLNMSGTDFVTVYESGMFAEHPELEHRVSRVAMLLPLLDL